MNTSIYTQTGTVETTDATPMGLTSIPLGENASALVTVSLIARRASNNNTKSFLQTFVAKRVGTGDATIVGSAGNLIAPIGDLGAISWSTDFEPDGSSVRVLCKGQSGATISWFGEVKALIVQP